VVVLTAGLFLSGAAIAGAAAVTVAPIAGGDPGRGREVAVAADPSGTRVVALFDQAVPGGQVWSSDSMPLLAWTSSGLGGVGAFVAQPFAPWAAPGNADRELYVSQSFRSVDLSEARAVVYRSTDGGGVWSVFFSSTQGGLHDRPMFDVDRTALRGGGAVGSPARDGEVYLTYDVLSPSSEAYQGSFLQVLRSDGGASGAALEIPSNATDGRGTAFQPVAGIADGVVHLAGRAYEDDDVVYRFRTFTGGTTAVAVEAEVIRGSAAGQKLGTTTHRGFNGHRMGGYGVLAIDRFTSVRGRRYFLGHLNPNPTDAAKDQGDLVLFRRDASAAAWTRIDETVPDGRAGTAATRVESQFLPMMDVDDQGIVHVAYYENTNRKNCAGLEAGETCAADVYYTSFDPSREQWRTPLRLSAESGQVIYTKASQDLAAADDFQLLGDYQRLTVSGRDAAKRVTVCWTALAADASTRPVCAVVTQPACGDGRAAAADGETCDDGNDSDADCCSPACTAKPMAASCQAATRCAARGACDAAAACVPSCFFRPPDAKAVLDCQPAECTPDPGADCRRFDLEVACEKAPAAEAKVRRLGLRAEKLLTRASVETRRTKRDRFVQRAIRQSALATRIASRARCKGPAPDADLSARLARARDRAICALYEIP
jgi:cysteine-rich repeat protein